MNKKISYFMLILLGILTSIIYFKYSIGYFDTDVKKVGSLGLDKIIEFNLDDGTRCIRVNSMFKAALSCDWK